MNRIALNDIELREIIEVKANEDFTLECEMENGDVYLYDMTSIKNEHGEMVQPLKDIDYFKKVFVEVDYITWPNGYSIDGTAIALSGKLIKKSD